MAKTPLFEARWVGVEDKIISKRTTMGMYMVLRVQHQARRKVSKGWRVCLFSPGRSCPVVGLVSNSSMLKGLRKNSVLLLACTHEQHRSAATNYVWDFSPNGYAPAVIVWKY